MLRIGNKSKKKKMKKKKKKIKFDLNDYNVDRDLISGDLNTIRNTHHKQNECSIGFGSVIFCVSIYSNLNYHRIEINIKELQKKISKQISVSYQHSEFGSRISETLVKVELSTI